MKKLILVAFLAFVSVNVFAQFFVGGAVSVASQSFNDRVTPAANTSQFGITLAPNAGYKLNDDMTVGGRIRLSFGSTTAGTTVTPAPVRIGFQPYFRYNFLYFGDFALAGEASTSLMLVNQTTVTPGTPDVTTKQNQTTFAIMATPVLLYQLNKHITLEASLNILNVGFSSTTTKVTVEQGGATNTQQDDTQGNFITAANANDIFGGGWGAIQVGFTYAF